MGPHLFLSPPPTGKRRENITPQRPMGEALVEIRKQQLYDTLVVTASDFRTRLEQLLYLEEKRRISARFFSNGKKLILRRKCGERPILTNLYAQWNGALSYKRKISHYDERNGDLNKPKKQKGQRSDFGKSVRMDAHVLSPSIFFTGRFKHHKS